MEFLSEKKIPLSSDELELIVSEYDTPLQIYDLDSMGKNLQFFLKTFRKKFPTFKQYFAVKALPNPHILKFLTQNGCDLDCSSFVELQMAKGCQTNSISRPIDIMFFTSNYTSSKDLLIALLYDVIINFDDITIIDNLKYIVDNDKHKKSSQKSFL